MKGKVAFVLGAAIGYVLGTRAGRERYEQMKRGAQHVWETEPVQRGVESIRSAVDVRVDELKHAITETGSQLLGALAKRVQGARASAAPSDSPTAASESQTPASEQQAAPEQKKAAGRSQPAAAKTKPAAKTAAKTAAKKPATAAKKPDSSPTDSEAS